MKHASTLFSLLLTVSCCAVVSCHAKPVPTRAEIGSDDAVILRWKRKKVTLDEIETAVKVGVAVNPGDPNWKRFKAQLLPGDEIWMFRSPGPTWAAKAGWQGYAIVRHEKLVETYTTLEN
ncbi:MAG: hypothetical protein IPL39_12775 [Opitutaceae bacterium]|nr:hypothetical protein [Opitutaceae bacterium]